jgi:hypothetical protein
MAKKYPMGVILSDVECGGPHAMKASIRKCPDKALLKKKIADTGGDRCYKCHCVDHPVNRHDPKDGPRTLIGGSGKIGSKGGPRKKGRRDKTMSAGK